MQNNANVFAACIAKSTSNGGSSDLQYECNIGGHGGEIMNEFLVVSIRHRNSAKTRIPLDDEDEKEAMSYRIFLELAV